MDNGDIYRCLYTGHVFDINYLSSVLRQIKRIDVESEGMAISDWIRARLCL